MSLLIWIVKTENELRIQIHAIAGWGKINLSEYMLFVKNGLPVVKS